MPAPVRFTENPCRPREQVVDAAGARKLGIRVERQPGHEDEVALGGAGVRKRQHGRRC